VLDDRNDAPSATFFVDHPREAKEGRRVRKDDRKKGYLTLLSYQSQLGRRRRRDRKIGTLVWLTLAGAALAVATVFIGETLPI
jgi:hypothetical protein|tara:strand:- start:28251 stop:28499 length:249 start_codon:yes stop_codon:yes gene_type:complete